LPQAAHLITVFALGMIIGAPVMTMVTVGLSKRLTLVLRMVVFVVGHVVVAVSSDLTVLLAARFVTAVATGAFWAVAAVVATRAAGPAARVAGRWGSSVPVVRSPPCWVCRPAL
jgi:predicted MFS family arabinose efflux permease